MPGTQQCIALTLVTNTTLTEKKIIKDIDDCSQTEKGQYK